VIGRRYAARTVSRRPNRFALVLSSCLAVLVVAVLGTACRSVESQAFDVDGRSTSQRDFDRELEAIADNDQFVDLLEEAGQEVSATDGSVSAELTAQWATIVIQQEIAAAAADREEIEVDDDARAEVETAAAELFGGEQAGGREIFDAFPEWFRDRVLDRLAYQSAYFEESGAAPTDDEVRAFYDENLPALVQGCPSAKFVSHILVASEEEANAVVDELAAGSAFETLARERSTDPSASRGGFLDCYQAGQYPAALDAAITATPVGQTTGPVQTEFGWHVLNTTDAPSFEALREQIVMSLGDSNRQAAFRELLEGADVELDPRYGTWVVDEQQAGVVPPEPKVPESTEPPQPSLGTEQPVSPPPPPPST